jgi:hypothetical protein
MTRKRTILLEILRSPRHNLSCTTGPSYFQSHSNFPKTTSSLVSLEISSILLTLTKADSHGRVRDSVSSTVEAGHTSPHVAKDLIIIPSLTTLSNMGLSLVDIQPFASCGEHDKNLRIVEVDKVYSQNDLVVEGMRARKAESDIDTGEEASRILGELMSRPLPPLHPSLISDPPSSSEDEAIPPAKRQARRQAGTKRTQQNDQPDTTSRKRRRD